jgi:hypothetical protein
VPAKKLGERFPTDEQRRVHDLTLSQRPQEGEYAEYRW